MKKLPLIFLFGPTAAGKTELAMRLADEYPVDLISVDSAMIYRGLDIGTAKPDAQTLQRYPHQLVDICDPWQHYSVANFRDDCQMAIEQARKHNRLPLCVGGTMMYFQALSQGLATLPAANPDIRAEILAEAEVRGWQALHQELAKVDAVAAARIHPNDPQRLQRALEVWRLSQKPLSKWLAESEQSAIEENILAFAIAPADRAVLHQRIADRFALMLQQGFIAEVQALFDHSQLHAELPAMRAVGYRQVWQYLQGEVDLATMQDKAKAATRQLAKRQLTWLRNWKKPITWLDSEEKPVARQLIQAVTKSLA